MPRICISSCSPLLHKCYSPRFYTRKSECNRSNKTFCTYLGVSLIMSNHFNYNSKFLVMPRHNIGRHLVFRASVIKWNDPKYRIHFTAKQGKDNDVDVVTPLSLSPVYRIPETKIFSAQHCWHWFFKTISQIHSSFTHGYIKHLGMKFFAKKYNKNGNYFMFS